MTKPWTKKAIKALQGQLTSFVVCHRMHYKVEHIAAVIAEKRLDVVLSGLRGLAGMHEERARKNAETADHFEANPGIYNASTPEMVSRFRGYAVDEQKGGAALRTLIAKVEAEGLPAEVLSFDPMGAARAA
jgi:uncharacterized membrane protein